MKQLLREKLSANLNIHKIEEILAMVQGNTALLELLYSLVDDEDAKVSVGALWVLDHVSAEDDNWLATKHEDIINHILATAEGDTGKRRLLFSILSRQKFVEEELRSDFLDYCLAHITMAKESTANRCQCMKLAYKQCVFFPELLKELETILDIVGSEPMMPAVKATRKNIMKLILKKKEGLRR